MHNSYYSDDLDYYSDREESIITGEDFVSRLENFIDRSNVKELHNLIAKYTS